MFYLVSKLSHNACSDCVNPNIVDLKEKIFHINTHLGCYLVEMLLLAVDKQQHPYQPDMLDQGVLCSRMEARLHRLHPLLLLDRLKEDEGLLT